jgi:hypothetical protein
MQGKYAGGPMTAVRGATLGVRFVCEIAMLAALGVWGARAGDGASGVALAIAAPAAAASVWWAFVAPKSRWTLPLPVRVAIEFVLFGLAALALWSVDLPWLAVALAAQALTTSVLNAMQERAGAAVP